MSSETNKKEELFSSKKRKRSIKQSSTIEHNQKEEESPIEDTNLKKSSPIRIGTETTKLHEKTKESHAYSNKSGMTKINVESTHPTSLVEAAIQRIKDTNSEEILIFLHDLSEKLSIASDTIAENQNCPTLVKELLDLLSRFEMVDIKIATLSCLNFLLDLNPYFSSIIAKNEGIPKLISLTQNVEYIDLVEQTIKIIEKLSHDRQKILLENYTFTSILVFIDFFDTNIKRDVIRICLNLSKCVKTMESFEKFIEPALPGLVSMTKLYDNPTETDRLIFDSTVRCFLNFVTSMKFTKEIYSELISLRMIDNLMDFMSKYLIDGRNLSGKKNFQETFKNVVKLLQIMCESSSEIINLLIRMNLMQLIQTVIKNELDIGNGKMVTANHSILVEIFNFLFSFFPKDGSKESNLLVDSSSHVYLYFSENILPVLLSNFVYLSSTMLTNKILKLINVYVYHSCADQISTFINREKLANILRKVIDSNDAFYIIEAIEIVESVMNKCNESFISPLIREGVVDNMKKIANGDYTKLYTGDEDFRTSAQIYEILSRYRREERDNQAAQMILDETVMRNTRNIESFTEEEDEESEQDLNDEEEISNEDNSDLEKSDRSIKENEEVDTRIKTNRISNLNNNINTSSIVKLTDGDRLKLCIKDKISNMIEKHFSNQNTVANHNLIKLQSFSEIFERSLANQETIAACLDLILNNQGVTFYELEESEILTYLARYLDENFYTNLTSPNKLLTHTVNPNILSDLKNFFSLFTEEKAEKFLFILQSSISSMNSFKVNLFEISNRRSSSFHFMNSLASKTAKVRLLYVENQDYLNEYGLDSAYQELHQFYKNETVEIEFDTMEGLMTIQSEILNMNFTKSQIDSKETPSSAVDVKNFQFIRKESEDIFTTEKIIEQILFERKQSITSDDGIVENINTFGMINCNSNANSNLLPLRKKNKYETIFYVELGNGEKLYLNKNWTVEDLIKEIKFNSGKRIDENETRNLKIFFNITLQANEKNFQEAHSLNENIFLKFYDEHIINNPAIYSIRRLSPFLFFMSLFRLAFTQFGDLFSIGNMKLPEEIFENQKVSALLLKQIRDPCAITSNLIPTWCKEFSHNFPFLSNFTSRYLYFRICSFDLKRSMVYLYSQIKSFQGETVPEDKLSSIKRKKFTVDRENIFGSTRKIMEDLGKYSGMLEFDFYGETGSGVGPTLEFYSLFINEIRNKKELWYKNSVDHTMFPAPCLSNSIGCELNESMFMMLGFVIARALYDDRLVDCPLNKLFWDLVLDNPISISDILSLDKEIGKALLDFSGLIQTKRESKSDTILYNKMKLEDIGINFVIPGYNHIELKNFGSEILLCSNNLEEYVDLLIDSIMFRGIKESVQAFIKGFSIVFPISYLKCFRSSEIVQYICGNKQDEWECEMLKENVIPNHGYDIHSQTYRNFIQFLLELDCQEKKKFISFITGSPRLPIGGFKNLSPKLTIVKKTLNIGENPDNILPTVMTCQNYLKIPDYSSLERLKEKMLKAMYEGVNSFDLS